MRHAYNQQRVNQKSSPDSSRDCCKRANSKDDLDAKFVKPARAGMEDTDGVFVLVEAMRCLMMSSV